MSQLLRAAMENGEGGGGGGEYTKDGSVDLRGNPVLRSKRGGWTACTFIVGTYCTFSSSKRFKVS